MSVRPLVAESEVEWQAIRAQGPGGQNVNKVANAVHLRFDIAASSLPEPVKHKLLKTADQRVSSSGVVVIKAQSARSLAANKAEALARLQELVDQASHSPKRRKPTKPTAASRQRRLQAKGLRSALKALRGSARD